MPRISRLALEHQRAARRRAHDHRVVARGRGEVADQPAHVRPRVVEQPVGLQRQAAAVLLGDVDGEAVVGEHGDSHLAEARLVVVRPAAVEVHDAALGGRRAVPARPCLERPPGEHRHRRVAVDPDGLLDQEPERAVAQRPVRDRRGRGAEPADERGAGDHLLA
jgi:hypothetical protein